MLPKFSLIVSNYLALTAFVGSEKSYSPSASSAIDPLSSEDSIGC